MVQKWDLWFVCNWFLMVTLWSLNVADGKWDVICSLSFHVWVKLCFPQLPLFGFCAHSIRACPDLSWLLVCLSPSCLIRMSGNVRSQNLHKDCVGSWTRDCGKLAVKIRSTLLYVFGVHWHHLCHLIQWQEEVMLCAVDMLHAVEFKSFKIILHK